MRQSLAGLMIGLVGLVGLVAWASVPPGTEQEIRDRMAPVGELCREGDACGSGPVTASGSGVGLSGADIYGRFCIACHATGVSDAPVFGDATAWAEREAKGMDALLETSIKGINLMPPMGTCMDCTEDELQTAIQHMLDAT